jgi:hypothetical protein
VLGIDTQLWSAPLIYRDALAFAELTAGRPIGGKQERGLDQ